jgi:Cupin domain
VRAGLVKFRKGLRTVTAGPGDQVVVPPGTFHRFANAGDEPAVIRVRVEPALRMEQLFETVAALAAAGRTLPSGLPRPLDLALFMREFGAEVRAPVAPGLVHAVLTPLASVAERRGLGQRYRTLSARPAAWRSALATGPGAGQPCGTRPGPSRPAPARPTGAGATARPRAARRRG